MKTMTTKDELQAGLAFLYNQFQEKQDQQQAKKLVDLLAKLKNEEWTISFSGHFSAGKSTLINRLLDQELLPHSPIPTSANIVKISSGEPAISVYFNDGTTKNYPSGTDIDTIQQLCKNGETIRRINIIKQKGTLPDGVSVIDTPGIDSANDADRVITESSLHLVDIIVYVMDYNHVQSEINLTFIKEMQSRNIPVFVVINQIDKHREKELSFTEFTTSVDDVFAKWGIIPERIFYTSLFDKDIPHNQWQALKQEINQQMKMKTKMLHDTIRQSAFWLIQTHLEKQHEQLDETFAVSQDTKDLNPEEKLAELDESMRELVNLVPDLEKAFRSLVDSTAKNALLTPFEVRDKAEAFLHASQEDFKPGLFASKKKAEKVRQERKEAFYNILQEKVTANLDWKLREKVIEFIKQQDRVDNFYLEEVQSIQVDYDPDRLTKLIKSGARVTSEYLLRYAEEVDHDIKSLYKQAYLSLWDRIKSKLEEQLENEIKKFEDTRVNVAEKVKYAEEEKQARSQLNNYQSALLAGLKTAEPDAGTIVKMEKALGERIETAKTAVNQNTQKPVEEIEETDSSQHSQLIRKSEKKEIRQKSGFETDELIRRIKQAEGLLNNVTGFKSLQAEIKAKRKRLEDKHYTVALFGAFSAGKSSFANALLGEEVLPVSPNPTTAVINRISPSNKNHQHGTVVIKVKSETALLADLEALDAKVTGSSLAEKVVAAKTLLAKSESGLSAREHSFLQAILNGYPQLSDDLGKEKVIHYQQLADYVAVESIACYLEWTELFYDCSLTRQGISLVDTPGADSINSRHTDVAFDYIKQADAILFVTYYNHAFSKADRDFLVQLGRVKDSFSLDKMFFIINASDLAKNHSELQLVEQYVSNQLVKFGIRQPRMFPLSSKQGLQEKKTNNRSMISGLPEFEEAFHHFLHTELAGILSKSAFHDIKRGANQLDTYIASASLAKDEKDKRAADLKRKQIDVKATVKNYPGTGFEQEIRQKTEKQLYYVMERDAIQYNDRFKEYFNPTTVTESGAAVKQELEDNTNALIQETRYQLSQEIRAVSLRLEHYLNQKAAEYISTIEEQVQKQEPDLSFFQWDERNLRSPVTEEGFQDISLEAFRRPLAAFRNKKAFFEKNEKEKMKESLYVSLRPYIEAYLETQKEELKQCYLKQWRELRQEITETASHSVDEYYQAVLYSLTEEINIGELQRKSVQLKQLTS